MPGLNEGIYKVFIELHMPAPYRRIIKNLRITIVCSLNVHVPQEESNFNSRFNYASYVAIHKTIKKFSAFFIIDKQ